MARLPLFFLLLVPSLSKRCGGDEEECAMSDTSIAMVGAEQGCLLVDGFCYYDAYTYRYCLRLLADCAETPDSGGCRAHRYLSDLGQCPPVPNCDLLAHLAPLPTGEGCDAPERSRYKPGLCQRHYVAYAPGAYRLCLYDYAEGRCLPSSPFFCGEECSALSSLTDARSKGEWCNEESRRGSEGECLSHYATWPDGKGGTSYGRCLPEGGKCLLGGERRPLPQCP